MSSQVRVLGRHQLLTGWREAGRTTLANPLRSALATLAIAVAVATIVIVVSGLEGLQRYARVTSARAFGADTFVLTRVAGGTLSRRELAERLERNPPITRSETRFLERNAQERAIYAPLAQRAGDVVVGSRRFENATINGTAAAMFAIRELGIARGRFLSADEERRAAQVAVLGADVADQLFPSQDPLGQTVRIARRAFQVIGLQARQGGVGGASLDRFVWIPIATFERCFGAAPGLQVFARAPLAGGDSAASAAVTAVTVAAEDHARVSLRARRGLGPGREDSFEMLSPEAARSFVARLSDRLGAGAIPVSVMALLAAIAVVTNTTLVSVTQRTREIGIRRAVGASAFDIEREVLAESALLALVGGALGLGAASLALRLAEGSLGVPLLIGPRLALVSLLAAGLAGVAAGWYPAQRAARIDVVNAIRVE